MVDSQKPSFKQSLLMAFGSIGLFLLELIKVAVLAGVTIALVRYFLFKPFYVKGASMEPNFFDKEYLIIDELSYRLRAPQRGEVVVFKYPENPKEYFLKRIIALPGETIKIGNNTILVNGKDLDEAYLSKDEKTLISQDPKMSLERMLSENEYFVLGDNRDHSSDSREFCAVKTDSIIGDVFYRYFPSNVMGKISNPLPKSVR